MPHIQEIVENSPTSLRELHTIIINLPQGIIYDMEHLKRKIIDLRNKGFSPMFIAGAFFPQTGVC